MGIEFSDSFGLSLLLASPLLGIVLLSFIKTSDVGLRVVAGASSLISFILSLVLFSSFESGKKNFQLGENFMWLPEIGLNLTLGIDGLSLWLIALTTFLTFLVCVSASSIEKKVRGYLISVLFLEIGMLGTFMALDVLAFYVFWEIMLIPMYFLIGVWGGKNRIYAALKFFIYTALGSLLMLVAIVYLEFKYVSQFNELSFLLADLIKVNLSTSEELWLFSAFAIAFLIKVPAFPFHTWLPDAHVEAPTGGSVILAGVLLKMGIYGLVRFAGPLFPQATLHFSPLFAILGVVGIVAGALIAWVQTDIKKLVAYSSVSHMGFCVLGLASLNLQSVQGALIQLLSHGISTAALFFLVGVLYDRKHTREISAYGGLATKIPMFSFVFMVFMLSAIGLPLTNGFVGEFLILIGSFKGIYAMQGSDISGLAMTVLCATGAVSGVVLGAIYMISLYRRTIFGDFDVKVNGDLTDLTKRESFVFAPLLVLVFFVGLFPQYILKDLQGSSENFLNAISSSNSSVVVDASSQKDLDRDEVLNVNKTNSI